MTVTQWFGRDGGSCEKNDHDYNYKGMWEGTSGRVRVGGRFFCTSQPLENCFRVRVKVRVRVRVRWCGRFINIVARNNNCGCAPQTPTNSSGRSFHMIRDSTDLMKYLRR